MSETVTNKPGGRSAKVIAGAVIAGLIGSGALVWQASSAAFTGTTDNTGNSWDAGNVALTDNDSNTAMFTAPDLVPGDADDHCIEVTYTGDVASSVKLYSNTPTGSLDEFIALEVEYGDADTCAQSIINDNWTSIFGDDSLTDDDAGQGDTLEEFAAAHTNFGNAAGDWNVTGAGGEVRAYRFRWQLLDNASAENQSATGVNFTWEAQND